MDDILVYTKGSQREHLKAVKEVFRRLEDAGLKLDLTKSDFMVKKVTYLSFIVESKKGISMDPEKIRREGMGSPVRCERSALFCGIRELLPRIYLRL
jgi:hypothetical protein